MKKTLIIILIPFVICSCGEGKDSKNENSNLLQKENVEIIYNNNEYLSSTNYLNDIKQDYFSVTGVKMDEPMRDGLGKDIISKEEIADMFIEIGFDLYESDNFFVSISYIQDVKYYHVELGFMDRLGGGRQYFVDAFTGDIFWSWGVE